MKNIKINKEQKLYVIPCSGGFTTWGFANCKRDLVALASELGIPVKSKRLGTKKMYFEYKALVDRVWKMNKKTGFRSQAGLYKPFIGHEGKRVEVVWSSGERERFTIGKSTGVIPCHLIVKTRRSSGGMSVMGDCIKFYNFI